MGGEERIWEVERVSKAEFPRASKIREEHPCWKLEEIQHPIKVVNPTYHGKLQKYLYVLCLHAPFESPPLALQAIWQGICQPSGFAGFFCEIVPPKRFSSPCILAT